MLKIRLQRVGRRNHAEFRMVVTEHTRAAKSSNYLEVVGNYNPHTDTINIDNERVQHWMSQGAQPSDTVHNLLVTKGMIKGEKKNVLPRKTPITKEEEAVAEESTPKSEEKESDKKEESESDDDTKPVSTEEGGKED